MPTEIPQSQHETPLRRQITSVNIGVEIDTGTPAKQLPTLTAQVSFTDLFTTASGVTAYPASGSAAITHAELLAIPNALAVIAAIQELAYTRALEQGI
jgi:hypothetical protein